MKTKNILKIGIFSIVLFALLISPILKTITPQIKAESEPESECEKAGGQCVVSKTTKCIDLGDYIQDFSLSCVGAGGGKNKCCVPNPYPGTKPIRRDKSSVSIAESEVDKMCQVDAATWKSQCYANGGTFWKCETMEEFVKGWCVFVKSTLEGFGKTFSAIMNLEIDWILWAMKSSTYGGFITNPGVQQVWKMVRDLTNILLILGLIGIAIATILNYKKYAWKQTLWKLIIVALLINFSLVIAGTITGISNYLSENLLSTAQEENKSLAPLMLKSFGFVETSKDTYKPPGILDEGKYGIPQIPGTEKPDHVPSYSLRIGQFTIISFVIILVGGFAVIALLAIFLAMLFTRCLIIILLVISPIAFAAWIFPDTAQWWKMWWEQFIKWSTFPLIFSFGLFLGVKVMSSMTISATGTGNIESIIQMVLFSMFLVGGLIFSIQGGGVASKIVMEQASKARTAVSGFVGKKTKETVTESPAYKKAGKFLTNVPLLGGVGQKMMVTGEEAKIARVKAYEKEYDNVSLGTLKELEEASLPDSLEKNASERRMGLTNTLAEKNEIGEKSIEYIRDHKEDDRLNKKAIAEAIPHKFKIEEGKLVDTDNSMEERIKTVATLKPAKIEKTQLKDIIEDTKKEYVKKAMEEGRFSSDQEDEAENEAYDKIIQEITNRFSAPQMAAFWTGLSPKYMAEKKLDGENGRIIQAIKKDPEVLKKFIKDLSGSRILREYSGFDPKELEKESRPRIIT